MFRIRSFIDPVCMQTHTHICNNWVARCVHLSDGPILSLCGWLISGGSQWRTRSQWEYTRGLARNAEAAALLCSWVHSNAKNDLRDSFPLLIHVCSQTGAHCVRACVTSRVNLWHKTLFGDQVEQSATTTDGESWSVNTPVAGQSCSVNTPPTSRLLSRWRRVT